MTNCSNDFCSIDYLFNKNSSIFAMFSENLFNQQGTNVPKFLSALVANTSTISVLTREVVSPSVPLSLPPGQSDAGAEIATTAIQQPSQTSFDIVLILPQAAPVGW